MSRTLNLVVVVLTSFIYLATADTSTPDKNDVLFECNFDSKTLCGLKVLGNRSEDWQITAKSKVIPGEPGPDADTSGHGYYIGSQTFGQTGLQFPNSYPKGRACLTFSYFKFGSFQASFQMTTKRVPFETWWTVRDIRPTKKWLTFRIPITRQGDYTVRFITYTPPGSVVGFAVDDVKLTKGKCPTS